MKLKLTASYVIIAVFAIIFLFRFYMSPNPFEAGYPFGFDGAAHYRRSYVMYQYGLNLWDPMQGNGFPSSRFYSLFPYYLIALFSYLLPFDFVYKMIDAISFAIMPILQYLWLKDLKVRKSVSLISSILFTIYGVHYRIALFGQQFPMFFSFIPLYLFLIFTQRVIRDNNRKYMLHSSLSFSFLVLSYPPAAYAAIIMVLFYALAHIVNTEKAKRFNVLISSFKNVFFIFVISFLIACFWIVPTVAEASGVSEKLYPLSWQEVLSYLRGNIDTYKDYFLDYYINEDMGLYLNSIAPYTIPQTIAPILTFLSIIFLLLVFFAIVLFFKENLYFNLSAFFLIILPCLKGIMPFYIFRPDHGMDYSVMFISFIAAYGLVWLINRYFKTNKKALYTSLVLIFIFMIYQFVVYSNMTKIYNFKLESAHMDFINLLKENSITKVYSCATWFLSQNIPSYLSWSPVLLVQNGIESEQIDFAGLMGIVSYGSSLPSFNENTTPSDFYNSLKLRGVEAVIMPKFCFDEDTVNEGDLSVQQSGSCSECKKNVIKTFNFTDEVVTIGETQYAVGIPVAYENYTILDQNYLPSIVFKLNGDVSKVNCDKEVTTFYRRISDVDIDVKFSSDSEDLTCTVAESNYPLWNAYLNGEKVEIGTYTGLMQFHFDNITSGDILTIKHEFSIHYYYSAVISIISTIVVVYLMVVKKEKPVVKEVDNKQEEKPVKEKDI